MGMYCMVSHTIAYHLLAFRGDSKKCFACSRQRTEAGGQPTVDDIDEFDDEETFLNLDDVLQGIAAPHVPLPYLRARNFADACEGPL